MDQSLKQTKEPPGRRRWRRSENATTAPRSADPDGQSLEFPASEIERILKEYACECYAVGRGESMYYLVEDLPRIARAATQEILAIQPSESGPKPPRRLSRLPRSVSEHPEARLVMSAMRGQIPRKASVTRGVKSLIAVLPFIAILTVIVLTIGLTFREFVGG